MTGGRDGKAALERQKVMKKSGTFCEEIILKEQKRYQARFILSKQGILL
ncbi:hypothetical protein CLOHYLEM_07192 [[Clostridium] hylemonae DSM 15053]|uniref:Uncharacterized protein n=1 Tax=[Clostridium] hylemonae DSM 15053 TaxID=553973 RepID=C0C523_9FIRM|nr:hypothetical protein CLOHYLEM_07192 [[Clostridium] hylemonae DSM 15053]